MSDTERIYSLYVQVNPVSDPDTLPLAMDDALLLTVERSEDMDTQVRPETHRPKQRRRRWGVAAVAFAAVVVVVGAIATLTWLSDDDAGPVAAADAAPEIVFDGASCTYTGPARIEIGIVEFSVTNTGAEPFEVAGWLMQEAALQVELRQLAVGNDMALGPNDPVPDGEMTFLHRTNPGVTSTQSSSLPAGVYLVDCVTQGLSYTDHVWRAATLEIVAP